MTLRRQLKDETRELLEALGTNRADVAATLENLGIRAVPRDPGSCAIASFLHAVLGGDAQVRSVSVHKSHVRVATRRSLASPIDVFVSLPDPVQQFILAFDASVYPSLIREPSGDTPRQPANSAG